ncbi:MAG: molecular chaperone TorD family protein [Deltaproteobacteria bacterium]|nr:molecular chaperone TorD family protein [Deltaproteobacteria bacterium]
MSDACDEGAEAAELALCRATLYSALALGFQPPTRETITRLTTTDAASALADAARRLDLSLAGSEGDACVAPTSRPTLAELAAALAQLDGNLAALAGDYRRLFGHTARGEVPAYETEYGSEALFQQPQEMADLAGFLHAFGLAMRADAHERVDHVSCECEFLSFLACKEAYAIAHDDQEMRAATAGATELFLHDHVGRFVPAFATRLARATSSGLYRALADLLHALVEGDCRRCDITLGTPGLPLRPDPATIATPMGCEAAADGTCPAGAGIA